jgi:hypothetical protein
MLLADLPPIKLYALRHLRTWLKEVKMSERRRISALVDVIFKLSLLLSSLQLSNSF